MMEGDRDHDPFLHHRGLRAQDGARRSASRDAGLAGVLVTPGPGPGLPHRLPADRDHRAAHPARDARRTGEPTHDRPGPGAPRRRGGARRAGAVAGRLDDGSDPYAATATLLDPRRPLRRSPTRPGRCTCSACSGRCRTRLRVDDRRAADAAGGQGRRTSWSGWRPRAPPPTPTFERDRRGAVRRPPGDRRRRRPRRPAAPARALAGRLHRRRLRAQRRQPAPRGRRARDRGRATWSCWTSAA